jgi:hypothetical protein
MKAKALFYFRRYFKDIEEKVDFDQEAAAESGMSYPERQRRMKESEKYIDEYEALRWIWNKIQELPD